MRDSKRKGVAGYIEGVGRLGTRQLGTAYYSEDMGGDVKGLGLGGAAVQGRGLMGREGLRFSCQWCLGRLHGGLCRCGACSGRAVGCGLWGPWGVVSS